ncbi:hypothetical protein ACIQ57_07825 [Lysinibacillus xylanilyticus]|uniref:hypothetical protein n=1 Tax=Lysinibacillus xylanilyticus TaxID=582475 RepID=UPI0037FB2348
MVGEMMLKKLLLPMIYVAEWVLFFYVLLCVFVFNMIIFSNIIYTDMSWEEPITLTSSFIKSSLIIVGMGLVCSFYIRYLTGNKAYKRFKEVICGILFGLNSLSCVICLSVVYGFDLSNDDGILLLIVTLVSISLTMQIIMKYNYEMNSKLSG